MADQQNVVSGMILDESSTFTLDELGGACQVQTETIVALVEEGIIQPYGREPGEWRFPASQLPRVRTATHLYHDLELNLAGVALAVELLEELGELRARVRRLETLL